MGVPEAIIISSLVAGGAAVYSAEQAKKGRKSMTDGVASTKSAVDDSRRKTARASVLAGDAKGIMSSSKTSGRGNLLGN